MSDEEQVQVIETEEIGEDGTIHKITKTITTQYIEESEETNQVRIKKLSTASSSSSSGRLLGTGPTFTG